jgi:SAM-dependent methyltransferase
MVIGHHCTASRAAWRQRKAGDEVQGPKQGRHALLSPRAPGGTSPGVTPPEIFDRHQRRLRRDRARPGYAGFDFLRAHMLEGIAERLDSVTRRFDDVLDLGCFDAAFQPPPGARITRVDPGAAFAEAAGGYQADEDRPTFPDASFDLIVAAGTLDTVSDLPGALTLARRALRPDGLFLAAFTGGATLSTLRATLREAEGDAPAARIHPQVEVRAAGDLLSRAGFALPVADVETLDVRYADLWRLLRDLRGMAATNLMPGTPPLRRDTLARAARLFAERAAPDGRTTERFDIIYLTGWAPAPSQPQPARRGSATASLTEALKRRD